jgi:hypothetical protein
LIKFHTFLFGLMYHPQTVCLFRRPTHSYQSSKHPSSIPDNENPSFSRSLKRYEYFYVYVLHIQISILQQIVPKLLQLLLSLWETNLCTFQR